MASFVLDDLSNLHRHRFHQFFSSFCFGDSPLTHIEITAQSAWMSWCSQISVVLFLLKPTGSQLDLGQVSYQAILILQCYCQIKISSLFLNNDRVLNEKSC